MKALITCMVMLGALQAQSQEAISETRYANNIKFTLGVTGYDKIPKTADSKGINRFGTFIAYDGFPKRRLSIGGFGGFTYSSRTIQEVTNFFGVDVKEKIVGRRFVLGAHISTYLMKTPKLDVYLGGGIGIGFEKAKAFYDDELMIEGEGKGLMYDAFLGVNYYFSENIGITGRFGYRTSLFQIGLAYRY